MHFNTRRKKIIHDYQSDVLLITLITKHSEEFWQRCIFVLLKIHVVTGHELLQELRLFHTDGLQDKFIVLGQVKNGSGRPWVGQLSHRLAAY